jgi:hypothetical protein
MMPRTTIFSVARIAALTFLSLVFLSLEVVRLVAATILPVAARKVLPVLDFEGV